MVVMMRLYRIFMAQISEIMATVIRTGICSYGMSGKLFHAPFIEAHPGFELTGMVERTKNESRERYPNAIVYRSVEEMLANDAIALIIVNTPVQTHFDYTKAALLAGKHVILEKPMTVHLHEAEELATLAEKLGLILCVYQNRRYDGDFRAVKKVLDEGALGTIKEVEIAYNRFRDVPAGKPHKEGDLPGAGILHDLGAHLIDQSLQLFGFPEAVFADVCTMRENVIANDYFELLLFYKNNLRVRLKSNMLVRELLPAYILNGSLGSFHQQRSDRQEEELLAGVAPSIESWCPAPASPDGLLHTVRNGVVVRELQTSEPGNYMGYFSDVHDAITGKGENPVPAGDGVRIIKIVEMALRSSKEKRVILSNG